MSVEGVLQSTELLGMKVKVLNFLEYMLIKYEYQIIKFVI